MTLISDDPMNFSSSTAKSICNPTAQQYKNFNTCLLKIYFKYFEACDVAVSPDLAVGPMRELYTLPLPPLRIPRHCWRPDLQYGETLFFRITLSFRYLRQNGRIEVFNFSSFLITASPAEPGYLRRSEIDQVGNRADRLKNLR